ncbi:P1 family peptidase [uncultured Friedmanniella sp.]|uniref:P1 family peptidase n=1 Tax=uncultured Friedmanniella sp. TaxID=335381 RepID=UPI0035CA539B
MITGFRIGHATADGDGWLTGTTVVLAGSGAVGGVDVRGGGPGTRETDLLDPSALVERVHAVVLTGGSAYGLAAADGVMQALEQRQVGFPVGLQPHQVVPIVPAAVIFDLGRGGHFGHRPTADFGRRALEAATEDPARGCVGAGTGATCGGLKGGFGYAEQRLPSRTAVAAAVVVNAVGSAVDPASGRLWADSGQMLPPPTEAERAELAAAVANPAPSLATTIGVVLTDASLTKAQSRKVAAVAHDGLARAVRPVHGMFDGDTIFCLASGERPAPPDPYAAVVELDALLGAAAEVFTAACLDAMLSATGRESWPAYADLVPATRS